VAHNGQHGHHLVVIGASAGGVEALRELVAGLPADFPAAVLVVLHLPAFGTSVLPGILERAGELLAKQAEDGEAIEGGQIYVAPPDRHMTVLDGHLRVDSGPAINGHRPAIDPLFESAARAHGRGVIGVVLSGVLDDGTLGAATVKRYGGAVIVQDPEDALYRGMPDAALEHVKADLVLPAARIGEALADSATMPPRSRGERGLSDDMLLEVERGVGEHPQPGVLRGLTCPNCNGSIWEDEEDGRAVFRCRVGHAYGLESFLTAQNGRVETALWTALRSLEERATLTRRLAGRMRARGAGHSGAMFERRAAATLDQAVVIRELLQALEAEAAGTSEAR
jgi:two-component system, chemotaxis family, protein-glutamate methylesterase/glutaminase